MLNRKGFTLVEMIIVIGLFSITIVLFSGIWQNIMGYWDKVSAQIELQQNLRIAVEAIVTDLKGAKVIEELGENHILIKTLDDNIIKYELGTDPYDEEHPYSLEGKTLYRTENSKTKQPVANFIKDLIITNITKEGNITFLGIKIGGSLPNGKELFLETGVEIKWQSYY